MVLHSGVSKIGLLMGSLADQIVNKDRMWGADNPWNAVAPPLRLSLVNGDRVQVVWQYVLAYTTSLAFERWQW